MRRLGDGGAARAEHLRDEVVRDTELVGTGAVSDHQEQAGEPLLRRVVAVARGALRVLREDGLRVRQKHVLKVAAALELLLKHVGLHPHHAARREHDHLMRYDLAAEQYRDADHALLAHEPDLYGRVPVNARKQDDDGVVREVDVLDRLARLVKLLAV